MATMCSKCGAQLEGSERFCVKCGNDVTTNAAAVAPAAVPMAAPPAAYAVPVPPPPGYAAAGAVPMMAPAPARVPMSVAMPPAAPSHKSGMLWLVVLVALGAGGWYYYKHNPTTQTQPGGNPPAQQPAQQPQPPGGGQPQQPVGPAPQQPGAAPPQQPGGAPQQPGGAPQQPGGAPQQPGGGANAALVQQQEFSGRWVPQNGYVYIENAQWTNHAQVALQSATLECLQYGQTGAVIFQSSMKLNGPTAPGATSSFGPFPMGAMQQGMAKVDCGIVDVTPAQ
ncbi:MAG TPA: zinc ribbon domain-containing protein [Terracidiphilus sp.]|nr:zinc ribbon domain-containing protein [Terracidiphilus sp.]